MVYTKNNGNPTDHGNRKPRSGRERKTQDYKAHSVVNLRNPCTKIKKPTTLRIATWNVKSLFSAGKLDNVEQEMNRLNIDVLGISDTQWPGSGKCSTRNDGVFYYSGIDTNTHRYGVGIIVSKKWKNSVITYTPYSERLILIQIKGRHNTINLIQVYAPTADKGEDEIEQFYSGLEEVLRAIAKQHINIIMGDLNAKVGQGKVGEHVGNYGLGNRNDRGDRLIQFCQSEDFVITNTLFKLPPRRLYTWTSPQHTTEKVVRNQIDYIMITKRYRNAVKCTKTYPGTDVGSDHNPVVTVIEARPKKIKRPKTKKLDFNKLRNENIRQEIREEINEKLSAIQQQINDTDSVDQKLKHINATIQTTTKKHLTKTTTGNRAWMTQEILDLMEQRRKRKNHLDKYKDINKQIKKKIKEAKEAWIKEQCEEMETYEKKYDAFNMYKKVKEITGNVKKYQIGKIRDKDGRLIVDLENKIKRWTEYLNELFEDDRGNLTQIINATGPDILKEEVEYAIRNSKNGKANGPDEIPTELLKLLNDKSVNMILQLFNTIYSTGIIPQEWLLSTFITIPKKTNAMQCSDHRTISLMSHLLKVFLRVIHNRIYQKLDMDIEDTQMGFRKGLGTREALFAINVLTQRCLDVNQEVHVCFVDFEKAFDKVRHDKLKQILESKNIDTRDLQIILNLYWNQRANIRIEEQTSDEIEIRRGVRQGCILSPLLFNIYSEQICLEALSQTSEGITINGEVINNIRYADDTVILARTSESLQHLVKNMSDICKNYGIKMNVKKTKYMTFNKKPINNTNITIDGIQLEKVSEYKYLGTLINETGDQNQEIKRRIEIARSTFIKMKKLFCNRDISIQLRTRMLKCYVFSTLLYGAEAWTLKQKNIKNIESFEMWCYRRILKISWMDRVTNEEVICRINNEPEVLLNIKKRKLEYLGHLMRGQKYTFLQNIMQGKIQGRRSIGRRRMSWMRNLREWFGCTTNELFKTAVNKIRIALMISNLR